MSCIFRLSFHSCSYSKNDSFSKMPSFLAVLKWLFFPFVSSAAFRLFAVQSRLLQWGGMRFLLHIPVLLLLARFFLWTPVIPTDYVPKCYPRTLARGSPGKLRWSVPPTPFLNNCITLVQKLHLFFVLVFCF